MNSRPEKPYFSIIIPAYNREREVRRAITSCLAQSVTDLEVVVVDDGSSDRTAAMVESLTDPRLILVRHAENQGVCRARNTGIDHSRGEWILFLDSDDELLPDALAIVQRETAAGPAAVDKLGFLYRRDSGEITPVPAPEDRVMDYSGFVQWVDGLILSDFFQCTRRTTFATVRFAQSRAYEDSYLLDFARYYKIRTVPIPVGLVHLDSANRISNVHRREPYQQKLAEALDRLEATEAILDRHGPVLRQHGPNHFQVYRRAQVMYSLLAGRRWSGLARAVVYLFHYPTCLKGWVILAAGLLGRRTLAKTMSLRYRLRPDGQSRDQGGGP